VQRSTLKSRLISFATLLPFLDFVVWVFLALTPTILVFLQKQDTSIGPKDALSVDYGFEVRSDDVLRIPLTQVKVSRSHTIGTVALPATVVETLASAPSMLASSWHPADFHLDSFRSFTYPLYCLPVWWFVGRGADGLFGKKRIGVPSRVIGSLLMLVLIAIVIGLRSASPGNNPDGDFSWILRALGIWILMFAVFPAVWLKRALMPRLREKWEKVVEE
jgi:hypothetical protein